MSKLKKIFSLFILALVLFAGPVHGAGVTAGTISATKGVDNTQFIITVTGVKASAGVNQIDCDVFSAKGSKDDLKNYVLTYQADSKKYTCTYSLADHYYDRGIYYIDVYATDGSGNREKIGETYALVEYSEATWSEWYVDGGKINTIKYTAALTTEGKMTPNVTANNTETLLKSGYGFSLDVNSGVKASPELGSLAGSVGVNDAVTAIQNTNTCFPEFNYKDGVTVGETKQAFNRLGVIASRNATADTVTSVLNFKENEFSTNKSSVHFTPLWYPDSTKYQISVDVFDAWTPAGMLSSTVTPSTTVDGQVYDDWHIAPIQ